MATQAKQRNVRIFLAIGAVLVLAAFCLSLLLQSRSSGTSSGTTVPVVVAKTALTKGTQLTPDMLTTANYSIDTAPSDRFSTPQEASGKYLAVDVTPNSPILASNAKQDPASAQNAALGVAPLNITAGYVAMAVPLNGGGNNPGDASLVSVGYWIQPDDHVDIVVANSNGTVSYSFQDVHVLKVGVNTGNATTATTTGGTPNLVIVELPRQQAEMMSFLVAKKIKADGTTDPTALHILNFVLRPRSEYGKTNNNYEDSTNPNVPTPKHVNDPPVSAQSLGQLFGNQ